MIAVGIKAFVLDNHKVFGSPGLTSGTPAALYVERKASDSNDYVDKAWRLYDEFEARTHDR